MNHIHERALSIVYDDYSSCFEDLINKDNSVIIHQGNLQQLAIEIFKVKTGTAQIIMNKYLPLSKIISIMEGMSKTNNFQQTSSMMDPNATCQF